VNIWLTVIKQEKIWPHKSTAWNEENQENGNRHKLTARSLRRLAAWRKERAPKGKVHKLFWNTKAKLEFRNVLHIHGSVRQWSPCLHRGKHAQRYVTSPVVAGTSVLWTGSLHKAHNVWPLENCHHGFEYHKGNRSYMHFLCVLLSCCVDSGLLTWNSPYEQYKISKEKMLS
jgi:hypothetical protein